MPARVASAVVLLCVLATPVVFARDLWARLFTIDRPRAIDGSGHYAMSTLYRATFPDAFGWVREFFAGMPFPNYYPPLFYWVTAAAARTGLLNDAIVFKLAVFLPILLIPAVVWWLAWRVGGKSASAAALASMLSLIPLLVPGFHGEGAAGLNYFDTFVVGLYTQPLGFLLCAAWYGGYAAPGPLTGRRFAAATALLTFTLLTNVFAAAAACVLAFGCSAVQWFIARRDAGCRAVSVAAAFALGAFWYVPVARTYDYIVTRPAGEMAHVLTPFTTVWYVAAVLSSAVCAARRLSCGYLGGLALLMLAVVVPLGVLPSWLPLQPSRIAATATYLCCIPMAIAVTAPARARPSARFAPAAVTAAAALVLVLATVASSKPGIRLLNRYWSDAAFYHETAASHAAALPPEDSWYDRRPAWVRNAAGASEHHFGAVSGLAALRAIVGYAREHHDGRYLIENPNLFDYRFPAFDGRALGAYLAAQGAETVTGLFRESASTALFSNPQANAFSIDADLFGISSALGVDLDFRNQPLANHLARCRMLGVRYLAIYSDPVKQRLRSEPELEPVLEAGGWTLFRMRSPAAPAAEALRYRPALVVGAVQNKARRASDISFTRLAEEQFASAWFDVLAVHSPVSALDRLPELDSFGALVLLEYDCDDCEAAYLALERFSQRRAVIAVRDDSRLCHRLEMGRMSMPGLTVLDRPFERSDLITAAAPSLHLDGTPVRRLWHEIRAALAAGRVESPVAAVEPGTLQPAVPAADPLPVLVRETYHPDWRRTDGAPIYAAGPMFRLTFVRGPVGMRFERTALDRAALAVSAGTALALVLYPLTTRGHARLLWRRPVDAETGR